MGIKSLPVKPHHSMTLFFLPKVDFRHWKEA